MTAEDIINEVHIKYGEWIEMSENPAAFVAGILANNILDLKAYIEYLQKRLQHVSQQRITEFT